MLVNKDGRAGGGGWPLRCEGLQSLIAGSHGRTMPSPPATPPHTHFSGNIQPSPPLKTLPKETHPQEAT